MVVAGLAVAGGRARAAPPLVVYHAPPGTPAEARDALATAARDAGAALVDLSPAPPPPPRAPLLLAQAIADYDSVRYDEAGRALEAAHEDARLAGAAGLDRAQLSDLFLYRALLAQRRGDQARAWEDLLGAAAVDPTRILDAARFPPKTIQAFQRAAREVASAPRGRLALAAPPGCRLFVDALDVTGAPPELPFGPHLIRAECPGAAAAAAVVVVDRPSQELTLAPPAVGPADADAALALARARDASHLLLAVTSTSGHGPSVLWLRLREARTGTLTAEASVTLAPGAGAEVRAAAARLLARATGRVALPPAAAPRREPRRWYQRPWVWGVAGVAVTAAILLPFAVKQGAPRGFVVEPSGGLWP